jgi:hypothetical protein
MLTEREKILGSIAAQVMNGDSVLFEGEKIPVRRVGSGRLRMVQFILNGRAMEAIEQNKNKPSRWGKMAKAGRQVVQFRGCWVEEVCGGGGGRGSLGVWAVVW